MHIYSDGREAFQSAASTRIRGVGRNLALEFAITKCIYRGVGRAGLRQGLGIGDSVRGAEDAEELVAFAFDAAEETQFLEDHSPRDDGEDQEKRENSTGDPSGLFENAADVGQEDRAEQKNG